jgi:hypothetical protein
MGSWAHVVPVHGLHTSRRAVSVLLMLCTALMVLLWLLLLGWPTG